MALTISNVDVLDLTQPVEAALHPLQQGRPAQGTYPQFYNQEFMQNMYKEMYKKRLRLYASMINF